MIRRVVILDRRYHQPSPFELQNDPTPLSSIGKVVEVDDAEFRVEYGTTVYAEGEDGNAFVWKTRY